MGRITAWFLTTLTVVVLLFGYRSSTAGALLEAQDTVVPAPAVAGSGPTTPSGPRGAQAVTGPVIATQWGPVQVQIVEHGGTITDVHVLQHPAGSTSDEINSYALPVLVQETLDVQSANIDMVSGATYTSTGYRESLQAALDEARL